MGGDHRASAGALSHSLSQPTVPADCHKLIPRWGGDDSGLDLRMPDMRGSRILEMRNNTYGHRAWADSVCGFHDTSEGDPIPPRLDNLDFMKKWTSPEQRTGWQHRADLDKRPRPASLPPADDTGKIRNYPPCYQNRVYRADEIGGLPVYPSAEGWKVNRYGNTEPTRYHGGISNWLPSHTEILWDHTKRWNKSNETQRVLHPVATKGTLQKRVRPW